MAAVDGAGGAVVTAGAGGAAGGLAVVSGAAGFGAFDVVAAGVGVTAGDGALVFVASGVTGAAGFGLSGVRSAAGFGLSRVGSAVGLGTSRAFDGAGAAPSRVGAGLSRVGSAAGAGLFSPSGFDGATLGSGVADVAALLGVAFGLVLTDASGATTVQPSPFSMSPTRPSAASAWSSKPSTRSGNGFAANFPGLAEDDAVTGGGGAFPSEPVAIATNGLAIRPTMAPMLGTIIRGFKAAGFLHCEWIPNY